MLSRPPLEVAVHQGDLSPLTDEWTAIVDPRHPGAAFRSAAWLAPWWKNNSTGRQAHVLVVRRGTRPVAMLPMYAEGRHLRLMGDGIVGSDYLGVIARREDADEACRLLAFHLASHNADEVELDGLEENDPLITAMSSAFGARAIVEPRYRCPFVSLNNDFDGYLNALPDGIATQWHRRRKWLEKRPGYRLDILRSPAEVGVGIDTLFELHHQRWALEGGSDAIDGPKVEEFHREAGRRLAALGWAVVFVLHAEGAARAALYGFRHGDRFAFYQSGHEVAWRPRSVGTVLLGRAIEWAAKEGAAEFDFLRGSEPYKFRWATGERRTVRVRAVGAGLRPWLNDRAKKTLWTMREGIKRALPENALELVRRARKGWR